MKYNLFYFFILILITPFFACSNKSNSDNQAETDSISGVDSVVYDNSNENEYQDTDEPEYESSGNYYEPSGRTQFDNYEETSNCVNGVVVYEGTGDYYVIENNMGYVIAETYTGWLSEGDKVRGELNHYGMKYIIRNRNTEVKVYIEDFMMSKESSIDWMGRHHKLKSSDQSDFDAPDIPNDY